MFFVSLGEVENKYKSKKKIKKEYKYRVCQLNLSYHDISEIFENQYYVDKSANITDLCYYVESFFNESGKRGYYKDCVKSEYSNLLRKNRKFENSYFWSPQLLHLPRIDNNSNQSIVIFRDTSSGVNHKEMHRYMVINSKGYLEIMSNDKLKRELQVNKRKFINAYLRELETIVITNVFDVSEGKKLEEQYWQKKFTEYTKSNSKNLNKLVENHSHSLDYILHSKQESDKNYLSTYELVYEK